MSTHGRWLKLTVAYDGTRYAGWQYQPRLPTVQQTLADAWQAITGEQPTLTASGRTDAGVHALGQVVGLATGSQLNAYRLLHGLNAMLPDDVVVRAVEPAPAGFHATHDALKKLYRYQIHNSPTPPLFERAFRWHVRPPLDVHAMRTAARRLVGRRDFGSFESAGSQRTSTVRTLTRVDLRQRGAGGEWLDIEVEGDGFLYNMVRAIAGTLVEVGRGARAGEWLSEVLAARDRRAAGPNAPPLGLVLVRVDYAI